MTRPGLAFEVPYLAELPWERPHRREAAKLSRLCWIAAVADRTASANQASKMAIASSPPCPLALLGSDVYC